MAWFDTPGGIVPGQVSTTWGLEIPQYDDVVGDPDFNTPDTVTFKKAGQTVCVLAFTYDGGGALTQVTRTA